MFWQFLATFAAWFLRFIIPSQFWPIEDPEVKIDPNARCKVCGATDGFIIAKRQPGLHTANGAVPGMVCAEHTCNICGGMWYQPALDAEQDKKNEIIFPASAEFIWSRVYPLNTLTDGDAAYQENKK